MPDKINDIIKNDFINPPAEYRPLPFWSWNNTLDVKELKMQLGKMKANGLGGYFMHARGGIKTEYLGSDWMKCVGECVKEGTKQGLQSWLYDENGWPSGFAGGLVTALGDEYYSRGLEFEELDSYDHLYEENDILGVYLYNESLRTVTRIKGQKFHKAEKYIVVRHTAGPYYIDVLNKKAVKAFIDCTHEKYYKLFGKDFGKGLLGFFTDEPRLSQGKIPWSYIIPQKFSTKYGYDIIDFLPALFIDCKGYENVRYDFWQLVSELFTTSFMKQIYDWCNEHDCGLTGHVMMEESIYSQMTGTSGSMPFYEYMSMPGVDWLRRMIGNPIVPKQVSSTANQMGKKFVLTESFALCGWNVSFEELKWIMEWQFVNGVNRLCQHLFPYSLEGFRKRDYPPALFYQQPWWSESSIFHEYASRLSVLLSSGKPVVNVLVIHPMRSGWVAYDGEDNDKIKKLDDGFATLSQALSSCHIDYHFGDETYLKKYGSVNGKNINVGKCSYSVVVMPTMYTCDRVTVRLLRDFSKNGGNVLAFGSFPRTCEGKSSEILNELEKYVTKLGGDTNKLYIALRDSGAITISISSEKAEIGNIRYQQRDYGDGQLVFLTNQSKYETYHAVIKFSGYYSVSRIIPEDGIQMPIFARSGNGTTDFDLEFLPMQSYFIYYYRKKVLPLPEKAMPGKSNMVIEKGNKWRIEQSDLNSMTLDFCDYQINDGEWQLSVPVIKIMDKLLALRQACDVNLRFHFNVEMNLESNKQFYLVAESVDKTEVFVNKNRVVIENIGWWRDTAFRKVNIKPFIKSGVNEIILKRKFYQSQKVYDVLFGKGVYETELNKLTFDTEIENVYLLGDFGVYSKKSYMTGARNSLITDGPFVIRDAPKECESSDMTQQGFCFFSGVLRIKQNITVKKAKGRILLNFGKPSSVVTKVYVNKKLVRKIAWAPYITDITDFVIDGDNEIELELYSSNRNLLGPHHHINGEIYNVGPESFAGKWSWCDRPTEAVPTNAQDIKKNYWTDSYCFVRFGLE